jgi:hypothetical protein
VSNVPRLDYLGSSCPRLLLEPQRTNIVTYSEQIDNAAWGKEASGTGIMPVVTANYTTSPDGTQNADRIQFSAVGKTLTTDYSLVGQYPITLGATGTMTWYMKSLTSSNQNVLVYWGAGEGAVFVATPQWQRFTLNNLTAGLAGIGFGNRGGSGFTAGGDETLDIALWGAQIEVGAYATSYIPTLGASVTRVADAASKTGISSLIGQTEGTIYFEVNKTQRTDSEYRLNLSDGSATNWMFLGIEKDNVPRFYVRAAASTDVDFSGSSLSSGTHKVAAAYKQNDFVLYVDGVLVGSDTSGNVGGTSQMDFGGNYISQVAETDSRTAEILLFKTRLTNSQLAELTSL